MTAVVCDGLGMMRRRKNKEGENTKKNWEVKWTDFGAGWNVGNKNEEKAKTVCVLFISVSLVPRRMPHQGLSRYLSK